MSRTANLAVTASAVLLLALAGCQQQSAPTAPTSAAVAATAAGPGAQAGVTTQQDEVSSTSSPVLSVVPATLATCSTGVVVTVRWNASTVLAAATATQIWVGPNATNLKLFSEGGTKGETQTGPWTAPGTHFVLKTKNDGKVLADTTVGGPQCG